MSVLQVETDPEKVGLSGERLARIERHFSRYVDDGRLAGWLASVARRGQVAYVAQRGQRDQEAGTPVEADTLWRWYSMTKPITSVAVMMLHEQGAFDLRDPVGRWIPSLAEPQVYLAGPPAKPVTRPASEPIRIWHLLTHTAGLTYGFHHVHPVDAMYRQAGFEWGHPEGMDLEACVDRWASLPLLFDPGSAWAYSVATDVLGRLVEVVSGQPLDEHLQTRILGPLGMSDTAFWVDRERSARLAALYSAHPRSGLATPLDGSAALSPRPVLSGGGGLIGSAGDYHRFTQMLLRGGELDGVRLLGPRSVAFMTTNHLPGGVDLEHFGHKLFAETSYDGIGFGLGFSVTTDLAATKGLGSVGEYGWGGAASTTFWVDPAEELTVSFFTQLMPSSTHPIRPELAALVYQAIVD
ncbi:MAG: serine hydrolase [Actinomycetota bacterium]|nr:serine hydrolase [Actinomycetota bacterium]